MNKLMRQLLSKLLTEETPAEKAKKLGLEWKPGVGLYGRPGVDKATHRSVGGQLVQLNREKPTGGTAFAPKAIEPTPEPASEPESEPKPKKTKTVSKKDKTLKDVDTKDRFNSHPSFADDGVSDADFQNNPNVKIAKNVISAEELEPYFLDEMGNTPFPRKYVKVLARALSVHPGNLTITDFTNASGAGTLSSTVGEILTMMSVTVDDDATFAKLMTRIVDHVKVATKSKESIIDPGWVKSAMNVRKVLRKRYDKKYGAGKWKVDSAAWDIADEVEGLGVGNYRRDKGFSTDMYLKIKVDGEAILDEISLKKEVNANLLNATTARVEDIMLRGSATPEDIERYEELNVEVGLLAGQGSSTAKRVRQSLQKEIQELLDKYNVDVPEDARVQKAVDKQSKIYLDYIANATAVNEINKLLSTWSSASPAKKQAIATSITKSLNQGASYTNKVAKEITEFYKSNKNKPFASPRQLLDNVNSMKGGSRGINKFLMAMMYGVEHTAGPNTESAKAATALVDNSHTHSRGTRDFLLGNKSARRGLLLSIREAFPLRALFEGEENMVLGDVAADDAILQHIFRSDDFSTIEQRLVVRDDPPPPAIVYRANTEAIDIPIAEIVTRPDGIGYGTGWKLEMAIHKEFGKALKKATNEIYP